jgi:hypothetical protein
MRIFFALPMTSYYDDLTSEKTQHYFSWIKAINHHLRLRGHEVFCALEHEDWGNLPPKSDSEMARALERDFSSLEAADRVIFFVDEWQSVGAALEFGWLCSSKIPTFIFGAADQLSKIDTDPELRCATYPIRRIPGSEMVEFNMDEPTDGTLPSLLREIDKFTRPIGPLRRLAQVLFFPSTLRYPGSIDADTSYYRGKSHSDFINA